MNAKQKRRLPVLIILGLIVLVGAFSVIRFFGDRKAPSDHMARLSSVYPEEDGTIALVANGTLSELRGVWKDHQVYLPLGIVENEINDALFWDDIDKVLLYTSATEVVRADAESIWQEAPVFYELSETEAQKALEPEQRVYVSLGYLTQFSQIEVDLYTDPLRAFIRSRFGECEEAEVPAPAAVRVKTDESSEILANVAAGTKLWVIDRADGWSRVYAGGEYGVSGFVRDSQLGTVRTVDVPLPYEAPAYTENRLDGYVCLGWHQTFTDSGVDEVEDFIDSTRGMNVIAPTWFSIVDSDGTIESRASHDYVTIAHERGLKVWALVENINTPKKLDYMLLLGSTKVRNRMVDYLMEKAEEYDLDGINLDLETLTAGVGGGYLQFIRELSVACRQRGLTFSVDNYVPSAWTTHYHRREQGEILDYFIVMAYDEHYKGSEPGSTASISFVENAIKDTLEEGVPARKLVCGLPFYSRLWKSDSNSLSSDAISMPAMREFMRDDDTVTVWDDELGQYYCERSDDGMLYRLWAEEEDSFQLKLDKVAKYDLAGIAGWKLGMSSLGVWEEIADFIGWEAPADED